MSKNIVGSPLHCEPKIVTHEVIQDDPLDDLQVLVHLCKFIGSESSSRELNLSLLGID